ncbi:M20/M25/M40 family metallo-hydrolase [Paraburkholderia sediminicola]|uniref:M20 family metallopeptidase n=1 Tax=Paraburkholderia sediminicola TaxID=458836 RepID=UPI0038B83C07
MNSVVVRITPKIEQLLADLVSIRSVNPALRGAGPHDSEAQIGTYVAKLLRACGVEVTLQEVLPGRHNVIGHAPRGRLGDEKVILLSAHMDTYPPSLDGGAEYEPRIESGSLFGRGSADAKGSLAAMLAAFITTLDSPYRRESYVVASVDEEYGLDGCRKLTSHHMRPHLAITGEPTSLVPIYAQKGIVRTKIRVRGDEVHAAYPAGNNAMFAVGDVLNAIATFNGDLALESSACALGPATVTPTRIESDGDMNKTTAEVCIWFDARTLPGTSADDLLQRLHLTVRDRSATGLKFTIEPPFFVSPANQCSTGDPLVKEFFRKIEAVAGHCSPDVFSYGSEAGVLSSIATASLVFGPGDARYAHSPGERVELSEVAVAAEIYGQILTSP